LSNDGFERRERKQTSRARRLRVPLDDVPRQPAAAIPGASGVELGDIEIEVAESVAPPERPSSLPAEPIVEVSYVASESIAPGSLESAPPQGFAMSAPPQGLAMSAPPQGLAMSAPPQGFAISAPPQGFAISAPPPGPVASASGAGVPQAPAVEPPRTSLVIVQRSVVITGEPPASREASPVFSPPPLRVPDFGPYAQGTGEDLEPENTLPGTAEAPSDARLTEPEGVPAADVARALAGDLSAWRAADSAGAAVLRNSSDFARPDEEHEFGDDDLIPGEPTRVTRGTRAGTGGAMSRPPSQPPGAASRPPSQPPRASARPPSQPPRSLPPPARGSRPPTRPPSMPIGAVPTPVLPLAALAAGLPPLPPVEAEPSAATLEVLAGLAAESASPIAGVAEPESAAIPEVDVAVELATDELGAEELATEDLALDEHVAPPVPPPAPVVVPRPPPAPPAPPAATRVTPPAVPAEAAQAATDTVEPPRRKKRARVWWEDFFNDDYLRTVRTPSAAQVARQCDFLEYSLGLQKGATILDVGCGLGLQAVELAARGYLVVGLDLSLPMLSRAADEAQDRDIKMNFLHGDMREMTFDGTFDAVVCLGTTFGYFDDDTNRQVLERMKRALKPQGLLLLDTVNRDYVVQGQPNLVWFEGDGCVCMEETQFNYISSRLHVKRTVILDDGRQRENEYGIRLYPLHEIGQLMHQMGFRVVEVSGMEATPGVYFGATSPRLILVAERRVERPSAGTLPGMAGPAGASRPPSEPPRETLPGDPVPSDTE
jgi:2-polyprenyl-3-methyl-5-hydroxy-6-metoxy-1,4-benzoquinol methylase